ncbi:hypothetical protein PV328_012027 [Microctonus aethiopoides]|uniref:Uncharacterized protein n=1 Tax=Microctonus aethiopoides TaxID=144406 RepID=A0AA39FH30_9HYME|nr:hypothetical protein PV328_012027 [Microctonus aethiopoides]
MNIGANIIKDLSPKENKFLEFVPPHVHDYNEILIKNFGNRASPEEYQFRRDLIEFHDSVMRIGRLREEDMNEYGRKVCPRCECVKKSDATIIRMMENLIYCANRLKSRLRSMSSKVEELPGKKLVNNAINAVNNDDDDEGYDIAGNEYPVGLQHMKQKEKEEEGNSDTNDQDASISATTAAISDVNEKDIYIMKDLIVYMMEEAGKIFTMSEKICNFMKQKI